MSMSRRRVDKYEPPQGWRMVNSSSKESGGEVMQHTEPVNDNTHAREMGVIKGGLLLCAHQGDQEAEQAQRAPSHACIHMYQGTQQDFLEACAMRISACITYWFQIMMSCTYKFK